VNKTLQLLGNQMEPEEQMLLKMVNAN